jgi:hypothetical protein
MKSQPLVNLPLHSAERGSQAKSPQEAPQTQFNDSFSLSIIDCTRL